MGRFIAVVMTVVLAMGLFACSKKESGIAGNFDDLKDVQAELSGSSLEEEKMPEDTKLGLSEEAGVPEGTIATMHPKRDKDSYFMRFVTEAPEPVYDAYAESESDKYEKYAGMPYYFEGTVRKVYDSMSELKASEDADMSVYEKSTAFTVDVDGIPVLVLNILPDLITARKDYAGKDLETLAAYKAMYDKMKPYDELPGEGEYVRIYGFYLGFDTPNRMPCFSYGMSKMIYNATIGTVYPDLVTEETVSDKFLNYVDFEKPVYWSDMRESSSSHYYYFDTGSISWDYYDNDNGDSIMYLIAQLFVGSDEAALAEWSAKLAEHPEMMNHGEWDPEIYDSIDIPGVDILGAGFTTIGPDEVEAFRVRFAGTYAGDVNGYSGYYGDIVLFEHKHKFIMLQYSDYATGEEADFNKECFDRLVDSIKLRAN